MDVKLNNHNIPHCGFFCKFDEEMQFDPQHNVLQQLRSVQNEIHALDKLIQGYQQEISDFDGFNDNTPITSIDVLKFFAILSGLGAVACAIPLIVLTGKFLGGMKLNFGGVVACAVLTGVLGGFWGSVRGRYQYCQHQVKHYEGHRNALKQYQVEIRKGGKEGSYLILDQTIEQIQERLENQKICEIRIDNHYNDQQAMKRIKDECTQTVFFDDFQPIPPASSMTLSHKGQVCVIADGGYYSLSNDKIAIVFGKRLDGLHQGHRVARFTKYDTCPIKPHPRSLEIAENNNNNQNVPLVKTDSNPLVAIDQSLSFNPNAINESEGEGGQLGGAS